MNERSRILSITENRQSARAVLPSSMASRIFQIVNEKYDQFIDKFFKWTN
jgi:hypothetical protein